MLWFIKQKWFPGVCNSLRYRNKSSWISQTTRVSTGIRRKRVQELTISMQSVQSNTELVNSRVSPVCCREEFKTKFPLLKHRVFMQAEGPSTGESTRHWNTYKSTVSVTLELILRVLQLVTRSNSEMYKEKDRHHTETFPWDDTSRSYQTDKTNLYIFTSFV